MADEMIPMAWATHHDEPMLFPNRVEALAYCDDGEEPIPLYPAQPPAVPVAELEALQRHELPYSGLGDGACGSGNDEITACAEGSLVRWPDLAALIAKYPA